MNTKIKIQIIAMLLIILPIFWVIFRILINPHDNFNFWEGYKYKVAYKFSISGDSTDYRVKTFIPQNSLHQKISLPKSNDQSYLKYFSGNNQMVVWKGLSTRSTFIEYVFEYTGKHQQYTIQDKVDFEPLNYKEYAPYLKATEYIQSDHPKIISTAQEITKDKKYTKEILQSIFNYVNQIPVESISILTDALLTLENNQASCNGKSRLMVALCRSLNIPARVVGGLILEEVSKRTSHLWVEVYVGNQWIPFDPLNNYFAELPSNYLEIYKGDHFLISRKGNIDFDYNYEIKKIRLNQFANYSIVNLWGICAQKNISPNDLIFLMLLPLGAFLVAIAKNVIGLKTYGVFLPVLIAYSLIHSGLLPGLCFLSLLVLLIGIINHPLDRFGFMHTPKLVVMLTITVILYIISMQLLYGVNHSLSKMALFFPIIILTITAEKFARKVEEESFKDALIVYLHTLLVILICYCVLSSYLIQHILFTFPESLLCIAGLAIILGKWIGLRLIEYQRFALITQI